MLMKLGGIINSAYYNGSCTSKDNEDPSWSTSSRPRETHKTTSKLWKPPDLVFIRVNRVNMIHTVKIDEVRQIVDVENSGKSVDEIDKETVSFGEMQLKARGSQLRINASIELHMHVNPMLFQVSMNLINISSMQIFDQLNISNEFAPFSRKSVQKLGIDLKLLQWHLVNIHIIE
ncbi:hypothetical protein Tco_0858233 [Tanacetum coccineum]|uniref:Uncharacterized protein n=1 Tax=Tanacetum coccineum TaxID=301880 RepID=A0ABQ5BCD0_9ASTR